MFTGPCWPGDPRLRRPVLKATEHLCGPSVIGVHPPRPYLARLTKERKGKHNTPKEQKTKQNKTLDVKNKLKMSENIYGSRLLVLICDPLSSRFKSLFLVFKVLLKNSKYVWYRIQNMYGISDHGSVVDILVSLNLYF